MKILFWTVNFCALGLIKHATLLISVYTFSFKRNTSVTTVVSLLLNAREDGEQWFSGSQIRNFFLKKIYIYALDHLLLVGWIISRLLLKGLVRKLIIGRLINCNCTEVAVQKKMLLVWRLHGPTGRHSILW